MMEYALLIPLLPLLVALFLWFFEKKLGKKSAYLAIGAMAISFLLSSAILFQVLAFNAQHPGAGGPIIEMEFRWLTVHNFDVTLGIMVDNLTAVMLMVVTIVALAVQVYSLGYMHGDPLFGRYYRYLSLFAFSMLGLVLANNILILFICWELVGLCSYLLIGFWYKKKGPQYAQKKAFLVTKLGDLGFLIGVMAIFFVFSTFSFEGIFEQVPLLMSYASGNVLWGMTGPGLLTLIAILLFLGAMGKSAQFPLHIWLPDAMEGPTPVSALIHAATMVAAGVYLVARMYPLFAASPTAMLVVAVIGTITLFMAATIALTVFDIKGVLAYSTISQLGYMMLGLGVGSLTAGIFHLMTHAFFKSLLFLGAGSVIHAVRTQDLREMGGLRKKMPRTFWTFLIATVAISGIPPFSGFWSKDEILLSAFHYNKVLFGFALVGAMLTALYMFRLVFMCFFGTRKCEAKPHESPNSMTWPMMALAGLSVVAGLVGMPFIGNPFSHFIHFGGAHHAASIGLMLLSVIFASAGIYIAYLAYFEKTLNVKVMAKTFGPLYVLAKHKYFIDEIVHIVFVHGSLIVAAVLSLFDKLVIDGLVNLTAAIGRLISGISRLIDTYIVDGIVNLLRKLTRFTSWFSGKFDLKVVDGVVNWFGDITKILGSSLRLTQTGQVQAYVGMIFVGIVSLFIFLFALGVVIIQ